MKKKSKKSGYGSKLPASGGHRGGYKSASVSKKPSMGKKRGGC